MYDYYGINYGYFDGNCEDINTSQKEEDIEKAREYILKGLDVPEELGARLLKYKDDNKSKNK